MAYSTDFKQGALDYIKGDTDMSRRTKFLMLVSELSSRGKRKTRTRTLILFENQIQTTSASPCRTQVQPAASFLVCSLIFIEY